MTLPTTLPPTDAPLVPGDGPLHVGARAESRARERGWLRWWWTSAALGVLGTLALVAAFVVDEQTTAFTVWFACWTGAILAMVPAHRLGWAQRHDRFADEMCRYAAGIRAEGSLLAEPGAVRLAGRTVGTFAWERRSRRRVVHVADRTLALQERVTRRDAEGAISLVELRLVDVGRAAGDGDVVATARGDRRGDATDWTLGLGVGELRLRQRLRAVPGRRTLLDVWGRAWRVDADADARHWTAELPADAGAVDAAFVASFLCHLDAVGLDRCYRPTVGTGPAVTATDGVARRGGDSSWQSVGTPGTRPDVPRADGGGIDL